MDEKPFQFTLSRLLQATAFIACDCAIIGWIYRGSAPPFIATYDPRALGYLLCGSICGFLGAAIGAITGKTWKGLVWGIVVGLLLVGIFGPEFNIARE